ncbi:MAG: hypothetical protein EBW76_06670 [Actinobacteria bacterium]|nr:hypothetical protein [Actinomycetota bacterium]
MCAWAGPLSSISYFLNKLATNVVGCLLLALVFSLIPSGSSQAFFGPKPGEPCSVAKEKKNIGGKPFICEKGKINALRWIPNNRISDSEKALALAFAGCVQGDFKSESIYWYPRLYLGAIVSYGYATDELKYNKIFDYDIYKSEYITATFSSAATLSTKWRELSRLWNSGVTNSVNSWKRGGLNGIEAINASKTFDIQIEGICKVAMSQVKQKAIDSMRNPEQWVLLASKGLLPLPFGS